MSNEGTIVFHALSYLVWLRCSSKNILEFIIFTLDTNKLFAPLLATKKLNLIIDHFDNYFFKSPMRFNLNIKTL